jgi:SAM-dependent methyltransferase
MADHGLLAATYDRCLARSEAGGLGVRRRQLLGLARGRVLEIGAGIGLNLAHYPAGAVAGVLALEPDGARVRRLGPRAASAPVPCEVRQAGLDEAAFENGSFDTVVATLALCAAPDVEVAASRIRRWLASDGQLLFLEHVVGMGWRAGLRRAVTPLWALASGGCRLDRDTLGALRRAGLFVGECDRFPMPAGGTLLAECVQGVARPRVGQAVAPAWQRSG